ncbi:MAG TPA: tetratricopeptide repeat protein [Chitinophagaceae bacterium]|nr:tetratricopeptide repeat protein [Chitinophagaceae bacterium]
MDTILLRVSTVFILLFYCSAGYAQIGGLSFDLPKPKKFENRKLRSEKTGDKKFTIPRRFMQNTTTHYNFYFNANEKMKEVLARAKAAHRDDYTKLLSFYNYGFEETAQYKTDLDSIIYKATAGILLHDLRSNWVDNLYLLIGRAYYLKKDFDSAYLTFQYLNYAFSPKEKDGYDKVIGSNSNEEGSAFSISTNEKRNIAKKLLSRPPSRNESLVWQTRTYIANDELPEAASLVQTLKYDPLFPSRLREDLNEAQAWYFYKQQNWDSAAVYLEQALGNTENKQETARWEYLIAQLYEASNKHDLAKSFYERVIKHTIDPVMEVYAVLNAIRQGEGNNEKAIQEAVDALAKMGRRDKYVIYRDIIYYTAAQIELDRKQPAAAKAFLEKSIRYSIDNLQQKNRSFLALANLEFEARDYVNAKRHYDSTNTAIIDPEDLPAYNLRKDALSTIAAQQLVIQRQDSLQKIAAMPEADRTAFLKKLLRQLRKQQGLKEDDVSFGNATQTFAGNTANAAPVDLFNSGAKADFYFANAALRGKGFNDFKLKWGNRPNADNWQRSAAIKQQASAARNNNLPATGDAQAPEDLQPLSIESLKNKLPLTPEKLKVSNDSILQARFATGKALQDNLEEYADAVASYETLRSQFPGSALEEQTLFNLYYCYTKLGDADKAASVKQLMDTKFAKSQLTGIINNPVPADSGRKKEGAVVYDEVYNLFIEGKFAEALNKKHQADSLYGNHFWSPQLLYIEAVYHVHQREDSAAIAVLKNISSLYPSSPMAAKARTMIDVLGRRAQIEEYLTNLQIERPAEDSSQAIAAVGTPMVQGPVVIKQPDTARQQPPVVRNAPPSTTDTSKLVKKPLPAPAGGFVNAPEQGHYVVLVMDKVDPVYVGEAKNAFTRYNKEKYYNKQIDVLPLPLTDDIRFVLIGKFENAAASLEYMNAASKMAPLEIIPWMPAAKYSFIIITENNLELLKSTKDVPAYKKFLIANFKENFK